jgi:hypothetical protein
MPKSSAELSQKAAANAAKREQEKRKDKLLQHFTIDELAEIYKLHTESKPNFKKN